MALLLALVALAYYVIARVRPRREQGWQVDTTTRDDGTLVVSVVRDGGGRRVVHELPPGLDSVELTSELRLAREDARLQADELNRSG